MKKSTIQLRYMAAKAAHETAKKHADDAIASLTIPRPTKDEIQAMAKEDATVPYPHPWYEAVDAINEQYRVFDLWKELGNAERDLITWGRANAERGLGERFAKIAVAFDTPIYNPKLRHQLVDICLRMEASA